MSDNGTTKQESLETDKCSDNDSFRLKRLEIYLSFGKFILSIFISGLFVAYLNHQIQKKELQLKEKELEQQYLKNFVVEAMDDNLEKRVRFAHYFSALLGGMWETYYQDLKKEFESQKIEFEKKQKDYNELSQKVTYKLTEKFFNYLKNQNLPENILSDLEKLKSVEFISEEQFIEAIENVLGKEQTDKYKSAILEIVIKDQKKNVEAIKKLESEIMEIKENISPSILYDCNLFILKGKQDYNSENYSSAIKNFEQAKKRCPSMSEIDLLLQQSKEHAKE